jgi:zinc D-Ala-D-Ala carboxypeptidase
MNDTPSIYHYFTDEEIKSLDKEFVALLDQARHLAGVPFVISSGYRTPEHNADVGGANDSAHCKGLAIDLVVTNDISAGCILKGLYAVGLTRIGLYFIKSYDGVLGWSHIHVDNDKSHTPIAAWSKLEHYV